jgi:Uma2 family endonuclease
MALPPRKPATYQDILDAPENLVAEIINGELHTQPRPAPHHSRASSSLGDELVSPFDKGRGGPGGWWILDEPELHLGHDVLVPDIGGWRRERMPRLPDTAWFELAPDWVCEVLSPGTARKDRVLKMPLYARYGVQHL